MLVNCANTIFLICVYVPLIILCFIANILVIIIAVKYHYIKSVTNIFMVNMSVADLLVALCMPIQLEKAITVKWVYGETICKIFKYLQGVAVSASVFSITMITVDRWLSISHNPQRRLNRRGRALQVLLVLWSTALLTNIPLLSVGSINDIIPVNNHEFNITVERNGSCAESLVAPYESSEICPQERQGAGRLTFGVFIFVAVYIIPGFITLAFCVLTGITLRSARPPSATMTQAERIMKERIQLSWILLVLALQLIFCWMPYNILHLLIDFESYTVEDLGCKLPYALLTGHVSSALNPLCYCLFKKQFRTSVFKLLCPASLTDRIRSRFKPHADENACESGEARGIELRLMRVPPERATTVGVVEAGPSRKY